MATGEEGPDGGGSGPFVPRTATPPLLSCLDQLLWAGQGWPAEEVPQSLAQLLEQTEVVSSPSDLLALLGTMTSLAKVVADTGTPLHRSALEVSSLSRSRSQLGGGGRSSSSLALCPSDIIMGCHMTDLSRVASACSWGPSLLFGRQSLRPWEVEKV